MKLEHLIQNGREKFNSKVRELGNKVKIPIVTNTTEGLPNYYKEEQGLRNSYRLGDLLTAKVNFRNAGAIAGIAVPWAFWYAFFSLPSMPKELAYMNAVYASTAYITFFPISVTSSAVGYLCGKACGEQLDSYLKNKLKNKLNYFFSILILFFPSLFA